LTGFGDGGGNEGNKWEVGVGLSREEGRERGKETLKKLVPKICCI
jgi:hypothetical protein